MEKRGDSSASLRQASADPSKGSSDGSGKQEKTSWISKKPDRCGGDACVRDSRIPVWVLVNYRRLGGSDQDLLRDYPSLTAADLEAASEYAAAHQEEIAEAIRENEAGAEGPVE